MAFFSLVPLVTFITNLYVGTTAVSDVPRDAFHTVSDLPLV